MRFIEENSETPQHSVTGMALVINNIARFRCSLYIASKYECLSERTRVSTGVFTNKAMSREQKSQHVIYNKRHLCDQVLWSFYKFLI